jgi:hypothetical protein
LKKTFEKKLLEKKTFEKKLLKKAFEKASFLCLAERPFRKNQLWAFEKCFERTEKIFG